MSVDDAITTSLDRLVRPVDDHDAILGQVQRRRTGRRHRRAGLRLLAAAAVVAVVGVASLVVDVPSQGADRVIAGPSEPSEPPIQPAESATEPAQAEETPDAPSVSVSVTGPAGVRITTSGLSIAANAWLQHTVTIENSGNTPVHVDHHRVAEFLGNQELLVGDEGCGYGGGSGQPVSPGCHRMLYHPQTVEPGQAIELKVTLWRDLPGMNPLSGAELMRRKTILVASGSVPRPQSGEGTPADVVSTSKTVMVFTYTNLD